MKTTVFATLLGVLLVGAGCVSTVNDTKTFGMPFIKDRVAGNYERPVDQVYQAAKEVVAFNGTLVRESTLHTRTNEVKTVEGQVGQRTVYVRVEAVDPKVTGVEVEARTKGGGADLDLAHEIDKEIALKIK